MHSKTLATPTLIDIHANQPVCCQSCHNTESFTYIGVQVWPQRVAEKLNIPQQSTLWRCNVCHTTITKA